MPQPSFVGRFRETVARSAGERQRVRELVANGRWREAEEDPVRVKRFLQRRISNSLPARAEAIQGRTVDFQRVSFLIDGAAIRRAVAYVEVNDARSSEVGSGFLVSPRLFLTCAHVIKDAAAARATQITFDREGGSVATSSYLLDPDEFALFSAPDELDYALVAMGKRSSGNVGLGELGCCVLTNTPDRHVIGMSVNVIQHPRGWPKMIAVRNNLLTYRTDRTLLYETDTEEGSSGSPVFNDDWDLVALHHWGSPFLENRDDTGRTFPVNVNEGVRISAVYEDLKKRAEQLQSARRELLEEALSLAERRKQGNSSGRVLSPPHSSGGTEAMTRPRQQERTEEGVEMNEIRVTIPIEVTLRVGSAIAATAASLAPAVVRAPRQLTRGAEGVKIDTDYGNRPGYAPDFIPGFSLPLPSLSAALAKQLVPLRAGEPDAADGELKYEHFSLKMNKSKRVAMFTATNIDGETYLEIDRTTGEVSASEGETWFKDPRISASFFLDQTFYTDWSDYFDRGHLTRRTDPTWGTAAEASRANADTFHFTNCSPQHFLFNQGAKYWQGAERYVLEKGVLAEETRKRICVIQGPIYDDKIDLWSDDVQIPSSFFKVIVWKGATALKAVGLVVDQLALLSKTRSGGQPHDGVSVDVAHWRVAIPLIEKRTGLDFGPAVRDADTISMPGQPPVGAEAARPIRSFEDILD
jgi:endonuclease G, mitochondrial